MLANGSPIDPENLNIPYDQFLKHIDKRWFIPWISVTNLLKCSVLLLFSELLLLLFCYSPLSNTSDGAYINLMIFRQLSLEISVINTLNIIILREYSI